MKTLKHIFLLLFTIIAITCCNKNNDAVIPESTVTLENIDIILSDNHNKALLKRKGHWGNTDNRLYESTYSSDSRESYFLTGSSLHINFINEIKELNLCIKDNNAQVIFEDTFSTEENLSYSIPITFVQGGKYEIEITNGAEAYYLIFTIQ